MVSSKGATNAFRMSQNHWLALRKKGDAHKYAYGHAAIISGPLGQGGAARLAARGALRIGAGAVSLICATDAVLEHAAQVNAVMVKPYICVGKVSEHLISLNPHAICIGPNLGLTQHSSDLLSRMPLL